MNGIKRKSIPNNFESWCLANGHRYYLDLWDYELNNKIPSEVGRGSKNKYYFKCSRGIHNSEEFIVSKITKGSTLLKCRRCSSFGQYMLDTYGSLDIWSDKNTINPFEIRKSSRNNVLLKCRNGHGDYVAICNNVYNRGMSCSVCSGRRVKTGINDIATTHPNLVKYFVYKDDTRNKSYGSSEKVLMKCPECGCEKYMSICTLTRYGFSCSMCSDGISYPNKLMLSLLRELSVNFDIEYSPSWAIDGTGSQRRYDFHIPSKKLIIEMDGGWHFKDNTFNGRTFEESMDIDLWKDTQAMLHGVEVVRIDSKDSELEYIKSNIINSKLSVLFNFDKVDWVEVGMSCTSSLMIKTIDVYNSATMMSVKKISNIVGVSEASAISYLNRGKALGLCKYDGKENQRKIMGKRVSIEKDGIEIGVFDSVSHLSNLSLELLGVKLVKSQIALVCAHKKSSYKGFVFRYM